MAKIFTANSETYVVATDMDQAVEKYYEIVGSYPTTMTLFKDTTYVLTESTVVAITPGVLPVAAIADGATVSPSTVVYIKEGDSITLTATIGATYTTFVNWTDGDSNVLSTDNPYTYTATSANITINANFTT